MFHNASGNPQPKAPRHLPALPLGRHTNDSKKRKLYRQFVNSDDTEAGIEFVDERGQRRPADWPRDSVPLEQITLPGGATLGEANGGGSANGNGSSRVDVIRKPRQSSRPEARWIRVGSIDDFPKDGGATIKYGDVQVTVFNFSSRGKWYACQNMCPHKNAFALSRGILGSAGDTPKVACPLHKKPFSLQTGECLSGEAYSVKVFPVKVDGGDVLLELPSREQLGALLATENYQIGANIPAACASCALPA